VFRQRQRLLHPLYAVRGHGPVAAVQKLAPETDFRTQQNLAGSGPQWVSSTIRGSLYFIVFHSQIP
jgi:hypothetical protein